MSKIKSVFYNDILDIENFNLWKIKKIKRALLLGIRYVKSTIKFNGFSLIQAFGYRLYLYLVITTDWIFDLPIAFAVQKSIPGVQA